MGQFIKTVSTYARRENELEGYAFFTHHYPLLPKLIEHSTSQPWSVTYDDLNHPSRQLVGVALSEDKELDLAGLFSTLARVANAYGEDRHPSGGTTLYYIDRCARLAEPRLLASYSDFIAAYPEFVAENVAVETDPRLFQKLATVVSALEHGRCIPSHGDLHELNMYSDGYLIDFEASGWNHVATDVSTFLQHTLFVGNHFGPKYARWRFDDDKIVLRKQEQQIKWRHGGLRFEISHARAHMVAQFLESYVERLQAMDEHAKAVVGICVALRMLTVFDVTSMSKNDQDISFALANIFASDELTLNEKLQLVCSRGGRVQLASTR